MNKRQAAASLPGACDCHVHLFGPEARFPFVAGRRYTPGDAEESELVKLHEGLGIERVVLVQPSVYGTDNSRLLFGMKRLGPRARAVAVLDYDLDMLELNRLDLAGVRGVRVNAATNGIDDPESVWQALNEAALFVARLDWHVQVLTRLSVIGAIADRIAGLPVPLVIDHFGLLDPAAGLEQEGFGALIELLRNGKVVVKISAIERLAGSGKGAAMVPFIRALVHANPAALLWGSDWPHTGGGTSQRSADAKHELFAPLDDALALSVLLEGLDDPDVVKQVLIANPARLYRFPAGAAVQTGAIHSKGGRDV